MKLSPHFTLGELTVTRHPYDNQPEGPELANLVRLCRTILEPWRAKVGRLQVTSGFRSHQVNKAAGGVSTSLHRTGCAADCKPLDVGMRTAWAELLALVPVLPIEEAILYVRPEGQGWIHVAWSAKPDRQVFADVQGSRLIRWDNYTGPLVVDPP